MLKVFLQTSIFVSTIMLPTFATQAAPDNTLGMAIMSAVVQGDTGELNRGAGVVSSTRINTGSYQVIFDRNVAQCSYAASSGTPYNGISRDIVVSADPLPTDVSGVSVAVTHATDGSSYDAGFHLFVFCAR